MSIEGNWKIVLQTPMGKQQGNMAVSADGSSFTGTITTTMGKDDMEEIEVDGDQITWTVNLSKPMKMTLAFTGTLSGDTIGGKFKGPMGMKEFSATRV